MVNFYFQLVKQKGILYDRSFWSLFIINLAIIVYYLYYHTGFKTLIWIYWCQSVLIGFFTFLDLITVKNIEPGSINMNGKPMESSKGTGCVSAFFAVHFGMFHFVYLIFIFTITDAHEMLDLRLLQFSVGAFLLDQLWNFIRQKNWERTHQANVGVIFFLPYLRVIPMHLTILLPQFIHAIPQMGIFLGLKLFADMVMYVITIAFYGKNEVEDPTQLRMGK